MQLAHRIEPGRMATNYRFAATLSKPVEKPSSVTLAPISAGNHGERSARARGAGRATL